MALGGVPLGPTVATAALVWATFCAGQRPLVLQPAALINVPLAERPIGEVPPPPPLPPPQSPPLLEGALGWSPVTSGWHAGSVEARTRITTIGAQAGDGSLNVRMASAFRVGRPVVVNPGGSTEEHNVLVFRHGVPFALATPLQHAHDPGEIVLQIGVSPAESDVGESPRVTGAPRPMRWATPAVHREPPLLGTLADLRQRTETYVHRRWGVEAAAALLGVTVLVLAAAMSVVQAFFEYNPFCLVSRRKGRSARAGAAMR